MIKPNIIYAILDNCYDKFTEVKNSNLESIKLEKELNLIIKDMEFEKQNILQDLLLELDVLNLKIAFAIGFETGIELKKGIENMNFIEEFVGSKSIE